MAKTLTDRTSVRVTAKSDTDANNQKKNDANNIAKALGKDGDLDDSKASSVASKLGNTITDENGTTWAKSSEVAAAAKELDGEIPKDIPYYTTPTLDGVYLYKSVNISSDTKWYRENVFEHNTLKELSVESSSASTYLVLKYSSGGNEIRVDGVGVSTNSPEGIVTRTISIHDVIKGDDGGDRTETGDLTSSFRTIDAYPLNTSGEEYIGYANVNESSINLNGYQLTDVNIPNSSISTAIGKNLEFHKPTSKIDSSKSEAEIKNELESKAWAQGKAAKINPIEPNETYIAVTDANGNPIYFLGT